MTPGACVSEFDRESKGLAVLMNKILYAIVARTTEAGSRTLVAAIAAGEESQGGYMADCHVVEYVLPRSANVEAITDIFLGQVHTFLGRRERLCRRKCGSN